MITMKTVLRWEPDVENYKLENIDHIAFGGIPSHAYKRTKRKEDLLNRDTGILGGFLGEIHGIKQLKLDMLKEISWEIIKDGRNPIDVDFHVNRTVIDGEQYLVVWAV